MSAEHFFSVPYAIGMFVYMLAFVVVSVWLNSRDSNPWFRSAAGRRATRAWLRDGYIIAVLTSLLWPLFALIYIVWGLMRATHSWAESRFYSDDASEDDQ